METNNKRKKLFSVDERDEFTYAVKQWIMGKKFYDLNDPNHSPGITVLNINFDDGHYIENLLYRDKDGNLLGYIQYEPLEDQEDVKPNLNFRVHPKHWREGIATKLLEAGFQRWPINLYKQNYSVFGIKFIEAFEKSHNLRPKGTINEWQRIYF